MSSSYNALVSASQLAAEDSSTEFQNYLPFAMDLAELRLFRDLDTYGFVVYVTASMSAGQMLISKPTGTFVIKSFSFQSSDGAWTDLLLRTDEFVRDYWPIRTSVGVPKYYANWGFNNLAVVPTAVSSYPSEFSLIVRPSALSVAEQTNWFTQYTEEALFFALMVEMMNFAKNPKMKTEWEARYQNAIAVVRNEARRTRRDDQTPSSNPQSGDNLWVPGTPNAENN